MRRLCTHTTFSTLLIIYLVPHTAVACFSEFVAGNKIDFDRAIVQYQERVSENPNSLQNNFCLGLSYHEAGRSKEALPYLEHAVKRDPGSAWYQASLGQALLTLGEQERGISVLEEALKLAPDDLKTRKLLVAAKEKAGWGPERELLAKVVFDAQALKPFCSSLRRVESIFPMKASDAGQRSVLVERVFKFYAPEILSDNPVIMDQNYYEFEHGPVLMKILGLGFKSADNVQRLREILEDRYGLNPCFSILTQDTILLLIERSEKLDSQCFEYFYIKAVETVTGRSVERSVPLPPGAPPPRPPSTPLSPFVSGDGMLFYAQNYGELSDDMLVYLDKYPHIKWLTLWSPKLTPEGLAPLKSLSQLSALSLGPMKVTDAGIAHISGLKKLEQLILAGDRITDNGLKHLSALSQLRELDLRDNPIGGAGLSRLRGLSEIESLNLSYTGVSDDALAQVSGFKKLKQLFLSSTAVSDPGLRNLEGLPALRVLSLNGTKVTEAGIESLKRIRSLREVYLGSTRIGDDAKQALRSSKTGLYVLD